MANLPPWTTEVLQMSGGITGWSTPQNPGDYTYTKSSLGSIFPLNAVATDSFTRMEPIITPEQLRARYLFGIPLYSNQKDPRTGQRAYMTDDLLKDFILRAISMAETLTSIDIHPVQHFEKHAWDKVLYESFGYFLVEHHPIISIEMLAIIPSNLMTVYVVPLAWIENAYFAKGQINIVPLTVAFQGSGFLPPSQASGGAAFLQILGTKTWIPAYWGIQYTSGFTDSIVPRQINELIGNIAAIEILRSLEASNKIPSYSLGIDGLSQSINTGGSNVYDNIIERLEEKQNMLINKVKSLFGQKLFCSNV